MQLSERAHYYHSLYTGGPYNALENIVVATHRQEKSASFDSGSPHRSAVVFQTIRRTQFISSLIASWGSKTEQTSAQSGSEPNQNCLIFASVELGIKRGGGAAIMASLQLSLDCAGVSLQRLCSLDRIAH